MTYFPFAATADDRSAKALAPMALKNLYLEPIPAGAPKPDRYVLRPWPGLVRRYTGSVANPCRGLSCTPGVVSGAAFGVFGRTLYSISSSYALTSIGTIAGADNVLWGNLRDKLLIMGGGYLYQYDGATLTLVVDADFPANAFTLTALDQRVIVSASGSDTFYWSDVLSATSWTALGFATSERRPDAIVASGVLNGDLWLFGKSGVEILRGGGDASLPFQTVRGLDINMGCAARDSVVLIDSAFFWVATDLEGGRVVCRSAGGVATRLPNRSLEDSLLALSDAELAACIGFSVSFGSRVFYVLRIPGAPAWAFDVDLGNWSAELTTWGSDAHKIGFTAQAFGTILAAGPDEGSLYTMGMSAYDDAGSTIERVATFGVPIAERMTISSLAFDTPTFDVPLSGQGSSPEMMVEYWRDAGRYASGAAGVTRTVRLAAQGETRRQVMLWRLGQFDPINGGIFRCTVTDPVGANFHGVRVNEGRP